MSTQSITHEDTIGAALLAGTKDRALMRRAATSPHSSSVTRFSVALNEGVDYDLLEGFANDPAPHVAELAAARLEGLGRLIMVMAGWAESGKGFGDGSRFMDAEGAAVVRHLTGHDVEILTFAQGMILIRHAQPVKNA